LASRTLPTGAGGWKQKKSSKVRIKKRKPRRGGWHWGEMGQRKKGGSKRNYHIHKILSEVNKKKEKKEDIVKGEKNTVKG